MCFTVPPHGCDSSLGFFEYSKVKLVVAESFEIPHTVLPKHMQILKPD